MFVKIFFSSSCVGRIPDNITIILLDTINAFTNTPIAICHHMYSCNDSRFTLTHTDDTVWMLSVNISCLADTIGSICFQKQSRDYPLQCYQY